MAFNNRPFSLLAVASKICENIGLNQFVSYFTHINNNNRLSSHKSGNRKFHSNETLNIHTTDAILEGMDNKKNTALESFRLDQSSQITSQIVTNRRDSFHSERHVLKPRRWILGDRRDTTNDR